MDLTQPRRRPTGTNNSEVKKRTRQDAIASGVDPQDQPIAICGDAPAEMLPERSKSYRVPRVRVSLVREGTITTPWDRTVRQASDIAELMRPLADDLDREVFWAILLDGRNRVTGVNVVAVGTLTAALVHPRELWKAAILGNAAAVIACHVHPSGEPTPSQEDIALTRRLAEVGELLGIRLLDHLVLGANGSFRSLAEDGHLGGVR